MPSAAVTPPHIFAASLDTPAYAQFVVNRELAAKVSIAVVPTGQEQGVLGRFLEQGKH